MKKTIVYLLLVLTGSVYSGVTVSAQEFPIAAGSDTTLSGGVTFDGTNYLIGIVGDPQNYKDVTAQLFSSNGSLVGPRISIGDTGGAPKVAFDGTKYLLVWIDGYLNPFSSSNIYRTGNIYGQFLNTSGIMVGPKFSIATDANLKFSSGRGAIAFNDTTFLVTYTKGGNHTDFLYGQRISRSGTLIGNPIQISSNYARETDMAYDGTNYLVAWVEGPGYPNDKIVYGQFLSKSGILVGTNFIIDGGDYLSDNPVSMSFDGSRYLVAFHEQAANGNGWNLYARFVTTSGTVAADRVTICDSTQYPFFPMVAFDGTNYLMTWTSQLSDQIIGRFFNTSGVPVDNAFVIFSKLADKVPFGGVGLFANNHFFVGATRIDTTNFIDGDVYGIFLQPLLGMNERQKVLFKLYPDPAETCIKIELSGNPQDCILTVLNIEGQQLITRQITAPKTLIDISNLPSGVYFVRLTNDKTVEVRKFVKQ